METTETVLTSGMFVSSLDGILTKSLLDNVSLSSTLDSTSGNLSSQQAFTSPSATSIYSDLDRISALDTRATDLSANGLQFVDNGIDGSSLFKQSSFLTSVASSSLIKDSTNNNSTTNFDPLTGNAKDAPLVSATSDDLLTSAYLLNSPVTENKVSTQTASPTFKTASLSSKSVKSTDANSLSDSLVSVGKFGDFDDHQDFQLTLEDTNGNPETFSLTGDGVGEVFRNSNFEQVIFKNTDGSTKVQISAFNNIKFGNYTGSSLQVQTKGSITAGNITLKNTTDSSSPGLSLQSGLIAAQSSIANSYSITDLTTLIGGSYSHATAMNNSGAVVGDFYPNVSSGSHVFLYNDGKVTDLGILSGDSGSHATAINDSGDIVGHSYFPKSEERIIPGSGYGSDYIITNYFSTDDAFLYKNGQITDLGVLPGGSSSEAYSINDSGQVVGYSYNPDESYAFLYSNGKMTALKNLPVSSSSPFSSAYNINNSGQILGHYYTSDGLRHVYLYKDGQTTDLSNLLGDYVSNINNAGQIVGGNDEHAFLYTNGQMTDLGTLSGGSYSGASDINDLGAIVGSSNTNLVNSHAFLYRDGKMTDLNSLIPQDSGWNLSDATAINNKGQILGDGYIGGQYHQFLLNPISTTATPKDGITVGNISTQGSSVFLQGLKINLTGSNVVTKGGNITLDGPTILNSSTGAYTFNSAKSTAISKGGDITFKNTLDSNIPGASSLSLTGGLGNITFNNAVGGNASLKDLTVNSAKTFTANGDITSQGNIAISVNQNITTNSLTSNSGAVKLTSKQGAVITQDITSDSDTIIATSQRIATGSILTNNGAVKLTSQQSFITTKNITTNGASVTVIAKDDITTRNILSNGGVIDLVSRNSSITTGYLRSDSSAKEGDITVLAADLVKVQGSVSINGNNYSIYSGKKGEGFITIQHGGGDTKVPFVVGNATENGTVGAISIGNSTIFPTSSRHDFSGSYTLGNGADLGVIRIISSDNKHLDKSLNELIVAESDDDPFGWLKALEWLGDKIFESVEWTFETIEDGLTQITNASGGRVVIQAGRTLTAEEADIAAKLAKEGRVVEAALEGTSNQEGVRYADFLVDGVKTELKTVSNIEVNLSATPAKLADKLSDSLSERIRDAAGQAADIIIDARSQPGINRAIAERAVTRAEGRLRQLRGAGRSTKFIRQIRVIGPNFDFTVNF